MSQQEEPRVRGQVSVRFFHQTEAFQAALLAALARIEGLLASRSNAESDEYLSRNQVAELLHVSTRWVERHLRPSSQPTRGGKAWYSRADVEAQMNTLRPLGSAPPRITKKSMTAAVPSPAMRDKLATIEASLRGEDVETTKQPPISARGRRGRAPGR